MTEPWAPDGGADRDDESGTDTDDVDAATERDRPTEEPATSTAPIASRRRWWLPLVALLVLLGGAGAWLYVGVWRYEPTALFHVPEDATTIVRADGAELVVFKPVREHLWPVLFARRGGSNNKQRVTRIAEATGIKIPGDLREVVLASTDGRSWVVLIGGKLERGRVVSGLHELLTDEGVPGFSIDDGLLVHQLGATIAQADDGTVILGTNRNLVEICLRRTNAPAALAGVEGAITFHIRERAVAALVSAVPDSVPAGALRQIGDVTGSAVLSEEPELRLELTPKGNGSVPALTSELSGMFSKLGLMLLLVPHHLYGAKEAISSAQVTAGEGVVHVRGPWPYERLDEAVQLLAKAIEPSK